MSAAIGALHSICIIEGLRLAARITVLIYCFTTRPVVDQVFYDKESCDQANYNDEFAHG